MVQVGLRQGEGGVCRGHPGQRHWWCRSGNATDGDGGGLGEFRRPATAVPGEDVGGLPAAFLQTPGNRPAWYRIGDGPSPQGIDSDVGLGSPPGHRSTTTPPGRETGRRHPTTNPPPQHRRQDHFPSFATKTPGRNNAFDIGSRNGHEARARPLRRSQCPPRSVHVPDHQVLRLPISRPLNTIPAAWERGAELTSATAEHWATSRRTPPPRACRYRQHRQPPPSRDGGEPAGRSRRSRQHRRSCGPSRGRRPGHDTHRGCPACWRRHRRTGPSPVGVSKRPRTGCVSRIPRPDALATVRSPGVASGTRPLGVPKHSGCHRRVRAGWPCAPGEAEDFSPPRHAACHRRRVCGLVAAVRLQRLSAR
ncbi:hypothetical protein FHS38_006917 [Streptomyces netropsis]|uniref:Uncharacterized protein n=1 Tax=Streptomyces netropsis TaxID=55404 RepID=A0A7W7PJJ1_STRNE|nr:hypothetical protein [Streptomyces netropsis]